MVNAWTSKKPVKYWRAFTPRDIPLDNDKPILYYEWNNFTKTWESSLLAPICRNWSHNNIKKAISIHTRLIKGGIQGTVIVEVHPKFEIGKYKNNIEVLYIYSENAQFNIAAYEYKIYETEYYIKKDNQVNMVTEATLHNMTTENNQYYCYTFIDNNSRYAHIISSTTNPTEEEGKLLKWLNTPGLKFNFKHSPSVIYNKVSGTKWKHKETEDISENDWSKREKEEPSCVFFEETKSWHLYYTFINFEEYYKGQIAKIESSNIRDDLDLAFLKAVQTDSTKTASFQHRGGVTHKRPIEKTIPKNFRLRDMPKHKRPLKETEFVYILYKNNQQKTIAKKCLKKYAEKLQEEHPEVKILTVAEIKQKYPTKSISKTEVKHPEGTFNRKTRRLVKQKNKRFSRNVKIQRIYVPIKETDEVKQTAIYPWTNNNGHEHKALFINKSNISDAVIKSNGKLIEKDSVKLIYHDVSRLPKYNIKRHNLKKQSERTPKGNHSENTNYKNVLLKELKYKYGSYDRRYTTTSDVENWSIQFFIVLKMIKEKERRKKVIKYLKKCDLSDEFITGFITYLHLTKNGDPTREHKRNLPIRYKRIMVTQPHLVINTPDMRQTLVIEHEVKDEQNGGVKNIITDNVNVLYNKKQGMQFFQYNKETNDHILISLARDVKKWAYVQEYKDESNATKWHDLVTVGTKEVPKVVKLPFAIERKVYGGSVKKWQSPIPQEKTVRYVIKKLNAVYKTGKYELLYSLIYNTVMEYYRSNDELYEKIRFSLYHNYTDLSRKLVTLIKANKMDDPDLVIFMEDLLHPH